jgi:RNA polymerase sigma-70 factor (ECF subfamily)
MVPSDVRTQREERVPAPGQPGGEPSTQRARREFEALLEPHLDGLFGTALRLTRNRADAEDLLQETVLNAWKAIASFQRGTNFKAWIWKILTNAFISKKRSQAREAARTSELVDVADIAEVVKEESFEAADWEKLYPRLVDDDVKHALDELPEEFRAPLLLSSMGGLAYKEIAEVLAVPIGTVMSRLFRARERMRRSLKSRAEERTSSPDAEGPK